ncbi:MAG: Lrp/AsnC family transcriptional regulator [Rhodocyclaceae bacterium]|nr:MAG: Lrp/AsnC family transcriptional regulator [Rhodocyclaceae bacterium]
MNDRTPIGLRLLNDYQRDFPLVSRPYADIAARLGLDEATVIAAYREGLADGSVSRIGAVVTPRRLGASTLAAMAVPAERLETVAGAVNTHNEVNHNYEREADLNLWFVVAAEDEARRRAVLHNIAADTGLEVLSMPLREAYHIDLGFDLHGIDAPRIPQYETGTPACALPALERTLLSALQEGLPITAHPYAELGAKAGLSEAMTLEMLEGWLRDGLVKRFGVVVRHRALGYTANAMCVWDVADEEVTALGRQLAAVPGITLCYRRERALPRWPYNLYCMIHGKARNEVLALRNAEAARLGLDRFPHEVLFSRRSFKQCGARYVAGNPQNE